MHVRSSYWSHYKIKMWFVRICGPILEGNKKLAARLNRIVSYILEYCEFYYYIT